MKRIASAVVCIVSAFLAGCGSGSSTNTTVTVSVTPATATVIPATTQQFTATVSNTSNTAVTWAVNGVGGGDSTNGTISASGLYTAPATIPTTPDVTVTATSTSDTTISAAASVLIQAAVTLVPSTTSVGAGQTAQFSATVNLSNSNKSVIWQVNGVTGGNSSVGTIDTTGLYTAPNVFPVPSGTITITAIAQADPTKKATATVTITAPPLMISPTSVTLAGGAQQTFTATALSQTVSPVWSVSCPSTKAGACGTITSAGLFTAPVSPPPGGVVTIQATMADNSAAPSSTTATIQVSLATLSGSYVFALSSPNLQAGVSEVGLIALDGNGNITSGSLDLGGNAAGPVAITGGTYSLGTDGRGSATVQTANGNSTWQFAVANHNTGLVSALDPNGATLTGTLDLQQLPASGSASPQGQYVISAHGAITGASPAPFALVGSITAGTTGNITTGLLDFNNSSAAVSATGSYTTASSAGRGTFTIQTSLGAQDFAYYTVSATKLLIVETDAAHSASGELVTQPTGPFSGASFEGKYVISMSGTSIASSPIAMAGTFSLDGGVGVTNRLLDGVNQTVADNEGSYFVTDATTGRTTVTWDVNHGVFLNYVLYPRSDGSFAILELDASAVAHGFVLAQTINSPSVSTLVGGFALGLSGFEPPSLTAPEGITGQVTFSIGQPFAGTLDAISNGAAQTGAALQASVVTVDPTSGKATINVTTGSSGLPNGLLFLYIVDSTRAVVFESDGTRAITGLVLRQF